VGPGVRACYAAAVSERNRFSGVWRLAVAAALTAWLAADAWLIAMLAAAQGHNGSERPFVSAGELLVPAGFLALLALVLVVIPWRLTAGWSFVFLFSVIGLPAWMFLRPGVYDAVPDVPAAVAAATVWMTLGLAVGLVVLSLLALRRTPEPLLDPQLTRDDLGTLAHIETPLEIDNHLPPRM
jgi:hypothetical protein